MKRYFPYILALVLSVWGGPAFAQQIGGAGAGVQVSGTPTTGNCAKWSNSTTLADAGTTCGGGSSGPVYVQTSVAAGDTVASGCTGTGCNFASGSYTFAAGTFCPSVGTVYTIYTAGVASTTATAGNIGSALFLAGTQVATAQTYVNANVSTVPWSLTAKIVCDTTGASGTAEISYQGFIQTATSSNNSASVNTNPPNTATFTVNTTGTVAIESRAYFSTASGSSTERQMIITKP